MSTESEPVDIPTVESNEQDSMTSVPLFKKSLSISTTSTEQQAIIQLAPDLMEPPEEPDDDELDQRPIMTKSINLMKQQSNQQQEQEEEDPDESNVCVNDVSQLYQLPNAVSLVNAFLQSGQVDDQPNGPVVQQTIGTTVKKQGQYWIGALFEELTLFKRMMILILVIALLVKLYTGIV